MRTSRACPARPSPRGSTSGWGAQHGSGVPIHRDDVLVCFEPLLAQEIGGGRCIEGDGGVPDALQAFLADHVEATKAGEPGHTIGRERGPGARQCANTPHRQRRSSRPCAPPPAAPCRGSNQSPRRTVDRGRCRPRVAARRKRQGARFAIIVRECELAAGALGRIAVTT